MKVVSERKLFTDEMFRVDSMFISYFPVVF